MSYSIRASTADAPRDDEAAFWRRHLLGPAVAFLALAGLFEATTLDTRIAAWLYDPGAERWIWGDTWWANALIHKGGRLLIVLIGLMALGFWVASWFARSARPLRRKAGYVFLSIALSTSTVGLLKKTTHVDCPWDVVGFGGGRPYVRLFEHRPSGLPRGGCFPSGHSSGGFSLLCFYFLFREGSRLPPGLGLAAGLGTGLVFGFGQWVRGAHFVSHDVWSVMICWLWALWLYAWLLRPARQRL